MLSLVVKPVYVFLRFQQQKGRAINTLKAYGTDLCLFWTFLKRVVRLSNTIRTRLSGRLMRPAFLSFIDGRQPICFRKASLSQPSNPRRSEISEVWGRTKARRRFADGLCALQKAATQHWGVPTPQKRVRIMLLRLKQTYISATEYTLIIFIFQLK